MSMWTTWPSCATPCHPMRLSSPGCAPPTCLGRGKEDYAELCWLWMHGSFTLLHDLLVHYYSNWNVMSFPTALQRPYQTYKQTGHAEVWTLPSHHRPMFQHAKFGVAVSQVWSSSHSRQCPWLWAGSPLCLWAMQRLAPLRFRWPTMVPRHFPDIPWLGTMPTM